MLPFDSRHITQVKRFPDIDVLNSYASAIEGTHDFTTFASSKDISESKFRDIYLSSWDIMKDLYGFDVLRYRVAGNAFLYHQVRSMTGTMLEAALKGEDAVKEVGALFRDHGLACGISSAAAVLAARALRPRVKGDILAVLPDNSERYGEGLYR